MPHLAPPDVAFRLDLPFGRCVGVRLPTSPPAGTGGLLPEEQAFAAALPPARRASWMGGRQALRLALLDRGLAAGPILVTPQGAPQLPQEACGSISHKPGLAVALAAPRTEPPGELGVDLEEERPFRADIGRRILTPREAAARAALPPSEQEAFVRLHFSVKESVYKAVHPFVRRFVSFQEAEVDAIHPDGAIQITLRLRGEEGIFVATGHWWRLPGHLLTSARVSRA